MRGVRAVAVALSLTLACALGSGTGAVAAIEPQPVNQRVEEEFWAHVEEHKRRGAAVAPPAETWEARLAPSTVAGTVGWCAVFVGSAQRSVRCPVSPLEGPTVLYEAWEGGPTQTRGYALLAGSAGAVTVDGASTAVAAQPVTGLTVSLQAAIVAIPAPFPGFWPDEIDGVVRGFVGSPHSGWGAPPLTPALTLPTSTWQSPSPPPRAPCGLSASGLRGMRPRGGRVVAAISPLAGIAGRGFLSCADTEYTFRRSSLDAAVLLDAAAPGVAPVPLPNAAPVRHHPGLYSAPGWRAAILARRISGAWLVVEGGASASVRERVLAHLHARLP